MRYQWPDVRNKRNHTTPLSTQRQKQEHSTEVGCQPYSNRMAPICKNGTISIPTKFAGDLHSMTHFYIACNRIVKSPKRDHPPIMVPAGGYIASTVTRHRTSIVFVVTTSLMHGANGMGYFWANSRVGSTGSKGKMMKLGDGSKVKMHSTPECSERVGFGWKQWSKDWLYTTRSGCFMTTG